MRVPLEDTGSTGNLGPTSMGGRVSSSRVPRVYAESVRSQLYVEIYMREQAFNIAPSSTFRFLHPEAVEASTRRRTPVRRDFV
jgi:hypothetical protein